MAPASWWPLLPGRLHRAASLLQETPPFHNDFLTVAKILLDSFGSAKAGSDMGLSQEGGGEWAPQRAGALCQEKQPFQVRHQCRCPIKDARREGAIHVNSHLERGAIGTLRFDPFCKPNAFHRKCDNAYK